MSAVARVLYQSLVKPFYRENAGTFVFVFTMFFFVVGTVDGADLFRYHYGLIKAIVSIKSFLYAALLVWFFYARKCALFIAHQLRQPSYQYISIFKNLSAVKQYRLFFIVDFVLLLPITFYISLILAEGFYLHYIIATGIVFIFLLSVCIALPAWHVFLLNNPEQNGIRFPAGLFSNRRTTVFYPLILLRAVFKTQKLVWLGIKLYTCLFLYFITVNNTITPDSLRFSFLFFSFGVLANGVFVNRMRRYEEQYLSFYRVLPVSVSKRFLRYAGCCLLLVFPEVLLLCILAAKGLGYFNALSFAFYAHTTLLLLLSFSFLKLGPLKQFVKLLLILFFAGYFIMMLSSLIFIGLLFLLASRVLFRYAYYQFEANVT